MNIKDVIDLDAIKADVESKPASANKGHRQINRMNIQDIINGLNKGEKSNENLLISQFLDDFYHEDDKTKYKLIEKEPEYKEDRLFLMCFLAAAAHKLANDYNIKVPEWVFQDKYIYPGTYYSFNTKNLEYQKFLEESTPIEFKERGLMVGDDILSRC